MEHRCLLFFTLTKNKALNNSKYVNPFRKVSKGIIQQLDDNVKSFIGSVSDSVSGSSETPKEVPDNRALFSSMNACSFEVKVSATANVLTYFEVYRFFRTSTGMPSWLEKIFKNAAWSSGSANPSKAFLSAANLPPSR